MKVQSGEQNLAVYTSLVSVSLREEPTKSIAPYCTYFLDLGVLILVECSFSIKLPTMWATHTSSAVVDFADDSSAPAAPAALAVPAASAAPTFDVCPERSPSRPRTRTC